MSSKDLHSDSAKLTDRADVQATESISEKVDDVTSNNLEVQAADSAPEEVDYAPNAILDEGDNISQVTTSTAVYQELLGNIPPESPTASEIDFFNDKTEGSIASGKTGDVLSPDISVVIEHQLINQEESETLEDGTIRQKSGKITGDFKALSEEFDEGVRFKFTSIGTASIDISVINASIREQEEEPEVEKEEIIDRNMYYNMHAMFTSQNRREKMKNNFLQSRLASYYMRRKMLYVLREQTTHFAEIQSKYEKELDALEALTEMQEREKTSNESEAYLLKNKCDSKRTELHELFTKLQHDQLEYGRGLTFDKTGKSNMDKVVERFVKRQKNQMTQMTQLRLKYIKLKNKMAEKMKALDALDSLGPGFRIMDYVQLKTDNRDLQDKLEEKECELTKLRECCQNTMQILAHIREKSSVVDMNTTKLKEDLEAIDADHEDARTQLHYMRKERDEYREATKNLRMKYGVLTNTRVLRDMENAANELELLKGKLETVKNEFYEKSKQVMAVRKNMEYYQQQTKKAEGDEHSSDSSEPTPSGVKNNKLSKPS